MPTNKRILELALEGLRTERRRIDEEIAEVTKELNVAARGSDVQRRQADQKAAPPRKRSFTAAQRKAFSDRMKKYWAEKRKRK